MNRLISHSVVAALLAAPAGADITSDELWDLWQDGEAGGPVVSSASETRDGAILRLVGVSARFDAQGSTATALIDWMEMEDLDDGSVRVTTAPDYDLRLEDPAVGTRPAESYEGMLRHSGAVTLVARDGAVFTVETEAPEIVVLFEGLPSGEGGGETDVTLTLTDLASRSVSDPDAPDGGAATATARSVALDIAGEDADQTFLVTGRYDAVYSRNSGSIAGLLGSGEALPEGEAGHGGSRTRLEVTGADADMSVESTSARGRIAVAGSDGTVRYEGTTEGLALRIDGEGLPIADASAQIERIDFSMAMPVATAGEARDFSGSYEMTGLTLSQDVWALLDPQSRIARSPASLALDLSGTARPTEEAPDMPGGVGLALSTLDIDRLFVRALGAELSGRGELDFTAGTTPAAPEGEVTFDLVGANGLIDRLTEAGILPPGQVVGIRMALSAFTSPGMGDDTVTSTVIFGPGGEIEIEGTRVR